MSNQWTAEQRAAIELDDRELVVSAAAGTGKTYVLVQRLLREALDPDNGIELDRVLVVTFTRAAAAELRNRVGVELRRRLHKLNESAEPAAVEPLRRHLRRQLAALSRAQISTIDSLCRDIVSRYGYLRGYSVGRVLSEGEARMARHELCGELLRRELDDPRRDALAQAALAWGGLDGVGRDDLAGRRDGGGGLRPVVLALHDFRQSLPDPERWLAERTHLAAPPLDEERCDPRHPLLREFNRALEEWGRSVIALDAEVDRRLAAELPGASMRTLIARRRPHFESLCLDRGWEELAQLRQRLKAKQELPHKPTLLTAYRWDIEKTSELYDWVAEQYKRLSDEVDSWAEIFAEPWADVARRENAVTLQLRAVWELTAAFAEEYGAFKRARESADFNDLARWSLDLLQDGAAADGSPIASPAARELRVRYQRVYVDEYQDTSPLQDALLDLLTADEPDRHRPRFIVGDVKQSIYGFRLAEPEVLRDHQQRLSDHARGTALRLSANFRSRARILSAVNHLFSGLMTADLGGEDYGLDSLTPGFDYPEAADARELPVRVSLIEHAQAGSGGGAEDAEDAAVDEDAAEDDGVGGPTDGPLDEQQTVYRHVAGILRRIHDEGRHIFDRELPGGGAYRRVDWRDMAVLLRTSVGRVETLRRELSAADVPHHAPGRSGFYERSEVADALALLSIVDNPLQDIALAAALTGPAGRLPYEALAEVEAHSAAEDPHAAAETGQSLSRARSLFDRISAYAHAGPDVALRCELTQFLRQLEEWQAGARQLPLDALLWRIYQDCGLLAAASAGRGLRDGEQRRVNLLLLHDHARSFTGGTDSIAHFLEYIRESRRAAGDAGEAILLAEGQNAVRVLTVHQAKGLEFPVVIVPDLQKKFNMQDLRRDVLWHFKAGIGGRAVDLNPPQGAPARRGSLAYSAVRAARQAALAGEELRMLYVALTRAREHLELVGTVKPGYGAAVPEEHPGTRAHSWLDWVGPQLAEAVRSAGQHAAAGDAGRAVNCGAGDCWEVAYLIEAPTLAIPDGPSSNRALEIAPRELERVLARLSFPYQLDQTAAVPAKLAVTAIAERLADDADPALLVDADELTAELDVDAVAEMPESGSLALPQFLVAAAPVSPDGRSRGTAYHRVLEALSPLRPDYADFADPQRVGVLVSALVQSGRLAADDAALVDNLRVARAVAVLSSRLGEFIDLTEALAYAELRFGLLIPAGELSSLLLRLGLDPARVDPAARMHVQGSMDLLIVTPQEALVLDYKTGYSDLDGPKLAERHATQLRLYARAAALLAPARRILVGIHGIDGAGLHIVEAGLPTS